MEMIKAISKPGRCNCSENRRVDDLGVWDKCPLKGGGHTMFSIHRCYLCGRISGFPDRNLDIALEQGTHETIVKLNEILGYA